MDMGFLWLGGSYSWGVPMAESIPRVWVWLSPPDHNEPLREVSAGVTKGSFGVPTVGRVTSSCLTLH